MKEKMEGLAQDCSNSIANALDLPQSYGKPFVSSSILLTHWGRVTHICVRDLLIIGSDNGLPSHYLIQCRDIDN